MIKRAFSFASSAAAIGAAVLRIREFLRERRRFLAADGEETLVCRKAKPAGANDEGNLAEFTKRELYEMAQELDIAGRSTMSKGQLKQAIAAA